MDPNYWEKIYKAKTERDVSWFQEVPSKSLELISELKLDSSDSIIDIGGGESRLVDHLLEKGFRDITVLDLSSTALDRARARLGDKARSVEFISCDIRDFHPSRQYTLWHDRAAFHFLTDSKDVETYLEVASRAIAPGGFLIVSTFSKEGPEKCSGLSVTQYSDQDLKKLFSKHFENIKCVEETHQTPWGSGQAFVYCGFKKTH